MNALLAFFKQPKPQQETQLSVDAKEIVSSLIATAIFKNSPDGSNPATLKICAFLGVSPRTLSRYRNLKVRFAQLEAFIVLGALLPPNWAARLMKRLTSPSMVLPILFDMVKQMHVLTLQDLAHTIGVEPSTVSRWFATGGEFSDIRLLVGLEQITEQASTLVNALTAQYRSTLPKPPIIGFEAASLRFGTRNLLLAGSPREDLRTAMEKHFRAQAKNLLLVTMSEAISSNCLDIAPGIKEGLIPAMLMPDEAFFTTQARIAAFDETQINTAEPEIKAAVKGMLYNWQVGTFRIGIGSTYLTGQDIINPTKEDPGVLAGYLAWAIGKNEGTSLGHFAASDNRPLYLTKALVEALCAQAKTTPCAIADVRWRNGLELKPFLDSFDTFVISKGHIFPQEVNSYLNDECRMILHPEDIPDDYAVICARTRAPQYVRLVR